MGTRLTTHHSPLISSSVVGKVLTTKTYPLQWNPSGFGGGANNPVRWKGTIGKTVTLDFGSNNAIKWQSGIYFPLAQSFVNLEIATAYLNSEFSKFYAYNAATDTLTDMTSSVPTTFPYCMELPSPPSAGGVIIATSDGNYALGGYRKASNNGFTLCSFLSHSGGTGKYGFKTSKWNILERPFGSVTAGTTNSNSI